MISYYDLIKSFYTEEEWEQLLNNEPIDREEYIDISPGSGFHLRLPKNHKRNFHD